MLRIKLPGGIIGEVSAGFFGMLCLFWEVSGTGEHGAAALLLAILLHEGGHLLGFYWTGIPVRRVTLDVGGICIRPEEGIFPFREQLLTLTGGSISSLLFAGLMLLCRLPPDYVRWQLYCGIFSLLPLPGLDGGEILTLLAGRWFPGSDRGLQRVFMGVKILLSMVLAVGCAVSRSFLPLAWDICLWMN